MVKHSFEDACNAEKKAATLAKERDATLQERDSTLKERDSTKTEASGSVEGFKKTAKFAQIIENHCFTKFIKIYCDLVTQICEIQPEFLVD